MPHAPQKCAAPPLLGLQHAQALRQMSVRYRTPRGRQTFCRPASFVCQRTDASRAPPVGSTCRVHRPCLRLPPAGSLPDRTGSCTLNRRRWVQLAGVAAVAGAEGAELLAFGPRGTQALAAATFRHYPFDPVALANFRQKRFVSVAQAPFGALDVVGALALRSSAASFTIPD